MRRSFSQKQIPTLLGLAVLVIGLVVGIIFIGTGGGVFAPRAAPQTTPKKVKITNVRDTSFTVSFLTDEATVGFVKYGTTPTTLNLQASDDRDQLAGSVGQYTTHYITVREVLPNTTYYFTLGTGNTPAFDNNGSPYTVKTATKIGNPPAAKTIYGTILSSVSSPLSGAMVYVTSTGMGEVSALTKESGSWAIPLSTARSADGVQYATLTPDQVLSISVQGLSENDVTAQSVPLSQAQPTAAITLGSTGASLVQASPIDMPQPNVNPAPAASSSSQEIIATQQPVNIASDSAKIEIAPVVNTDQPTITGQVPPNTTISIEIHSNEQINTTVTSNQNGQYSVDLEALKKNLEPGPHTVTISYVDPATGKTVTETKSFVVEKTATLAAASSPSPSPFSSGNPFVITSPSPTASASATPIVSIKPLPTPIAQTTMPATSSALPQSGSIDATFALLIVGTMLLFVGSWSVFQVTSPLKLRRHSR